MVRITPIAALFFLCSMTSSPSAAAGDAPPLHLSAWKGEYFDTRQGALYVKMDFQGFPASAQTRYLTGNVQVQLYNILRQQTYVFSYTPGSLEGRPREIWKLPTGKYRLRSIVMVDAFGVRRSWVEAAATGVGVIVQKQSISNLGIWTLSPKATNQLSVKFAMVPDSYSEEGPKAASSVAAVVNGFNGRIQKVVGGKRVVTGSKLDHATKEEMRAVIRSTRQIAMFFKLDLFRYNVYAREIATVLSSYDPNLRSCYTRLLDADPKAAGTLVFGFALNKDTGQMKKISRTGGSLADPRLTECLVLEMAHMQFPAKANILGELTFTFDAH